MNWRPWLQSRIANPVLFFVVFILLLAVGIKEGALSADGLVARKDLIEVVGTIVSSFVLIAGGMLAYVRFFRGRTLSPKLTIHLTPGAEKAPSGNGVLHWLDVELKNAGSVAIWNYEVEIVAVTHGETRRKERISDLVRPPVDVFLAEQRGDAERLLDVGESAYEHAFVTLPADVTVVTFQVIVRAAGSSLWDRSVTVSNRASRPSANSE